MGGLIDRQAVLDALAKFVPYAICDESTESYTNGLTDAYNLICQLPTAQPTLRERALTLLLNWAVDCGFGYDNFPEEYERCKDEIKGMGYFDGMIYIAEKEVERNERPD